LENTGSVDVEIVEIKWVSGGSPAEEISANGGNPSFKTNGNGLFTETIEKGKRRYELNTTDTLSAGETKTYDFDRFRGGGSQINMNGKTITITLYFNEREPEKITLNF
jgi:hypothetical protein